jgi:hypothetical protein
MVFRKRDVAVSAHEDLGPLDQPCAGVAVHRPRPGWVEADLPVPESADRRLAIGDDGALGAEDLAVPSVVAEKADLGKCGCEERRVAQSAASAAVVSVICHT